MFLQILALPHAQGRFIANINSCDINIGAVLLQEKQEGWSIQAQYLSILLKKAKCSYTMTERKTLALVRKLVLLHTFLKGNQFAASTDLSAGH